MVTTPPGADPQTMSSLEIAELTGKEHFNVMRDIRVMLEALHGDGSKFGLIYRDAMNREKPCYGLPYDETITLMAGYDAALRFKIVRRWRELEQAKPALPNFSNPAEAPRAWAERYEGKQKALAQVAAMSLIISNCLAAAQTHGTLSHSTIASSTSLMDRVGSPSMTSVAIERDPLTPPI